MYEAGNPDKRPSAVKFKSWLDAALGDFESEEAPGMAREASVLTDDRDAMDAPSTDRQVSSASLMRRSSSGGPPKLRRQQSASDLNVQKRKRRARARREAALSVLPLPLFQPTDQEQMAAAFAALRDVPAVVDHFVLNHVFPKVMNHQKQKLMASGIDMGSDMLFEKRLGFSGTTSDLLPTGMTCDFEPGSEAKIVRTLTNPSVISTMDLQGDWDSQFILRTIATAKPRFHALIDVGALVTGMTN